MNPFPDTPIAHESPKELANSSLQHCLAPFEERLSRGKNLLAFSGGVDSSALYHLLHTSGYPFDLALMHYGRRKEADTEAAHAEQLAMKDGRRCFIKRVKLLDANFESQARMARFAFFESLIERHGYEHLLLAHQLDDRLEWLLMQLCKGAGAVELAGMRAQEFRGSYEILRPLLLIPRSIIKRYLEIHNIRHFQDASNEDFHHQRNRFRAQFASPLMAEFASGIASSFTLLDADREQLLPLEGLRNHAHLYLIPRTLKGAVQIRLADWVCKRLGILLSKPQRQELLRQKSGVLSSTVAFAQDDSWLYLAPHLSLIIPKPFREACRIQGWPPRMRPYLYSLCSLHDLGPDPEELARRLKG